MDGKALSYGLWIESLKFTFTTYCPDIMKSLKMKYCSLGGEEQKEFSNIRELLVRG